MIELALKKVQEQQIYAIARLLRDLQILSILMSSPDNMTEKLRKMEYQTLKEKFIGVKTYREMKEIRGKIKEIKDKYDAENN